MASVAGKEAHTMLESKGWNLVEKGGSWIVKGAEGAAIVGLEAEPIGWAIDAGVAYNAIADLVEAHPEYAADAAQLLAKAKSGASLKELSQQAGDMYKQITSKMSPQDANK